MTDLLDPPGTRTPTRDPAGRPLTLGSALAGLAAAATGLAGCLALALVAWFASDAGSHGTTRDALRVGADAWLLAHGGHLRLGATGVPTTITAVPLGMTVLGLLLSHRFGRRAAAAAPARDPRTLLVGVGVLSGLYAVVGLVTALLSATATARVGLPGAFLGSFLVAFLGGGTGLVRGAGDALDWRARLPERVRAVVLGALSSTLLLVALGSVLAAAALLTDLGSAANVLSRLHADSSGGLLYTAVVAAVAPNAVLLSTAYLLGPGFAVGTGTLVSPAAVELGRVPAFPLLAALPSPGTPPTWVTVLVAAPVAAAVAGTVLMLRRHPVLTYDAGAARGLASGVLGALLLTGLEALAGGAVGPGRMADLGAPLLDVLVAATVAMGVGGLFAGVAATWWARRR